MPRARSVTRRRRTPTRTRRSIRRTVRRVRRRVLRRQPFTESSFRRKRISDPRATARIKCEYEFMFSNKHLDQFPHVNSAIMAVDLTEVLRNSERFKDIMSGYE